MKNVIVKTTLSNLVLIEIPDEYRLTLEVWQAENLITALAMAVDGLKEKEEN